MTPNPRAKLYLDIRTHLKAANFKFFERPSARQFMLLMRGDEVTVPVVLTVRPDGMAFRLETKVPVMAPETRRLAASQLVARLNARTDRGHYDLDLDNGEVDFRIDCHAPASAVDRRSFLLVLKMTLDPVLVDFRALESVLLHDADPKEAVDALEAARTAARDAAARDAAVRQRKVDIDRKAAEESGPPSDAGPRKRPRKRLKSFLDGEDAEESAPKDEADGDGIHRTPLPPPGPELDELMKMFDDPAPAPGAPEAMAEDADGEDGEDEHPEFPFDEGDQPGKG